VTAPALPSVLRALPRRAVSRLLGQLGRLRVPRPLLTPVLGWYARRFGVDLAELDRPLADYRTFLEFFTRRLPPGARSWPSDPRAVTSPADGKVVRAGDVLPETTFAPKGAPYPLDHLLGAPGAGDLFLGGTYLTAYLAPGDYHRFHWPWNGRALAVRHLPGDLWPVHPGAVASVPRLFARNERVVVRGATEGGGAFAIVPVGALNVGSIRLTAFPRLRTNRSVLGARSYPVRDVRGPQVGGPGEGQRGAELGWFEFGSAIVLLLARDAGRLEPLAPGTPLRVGQPIGTLAD
jgi:phosphatidylserine decarboxylase